MTSESLPLWYEASSDGRLVPLRFSDGGASRCPPFDEPVEPPEESQADHHDQERDDRRVGPIVLGHDAGGCLPLRLVDAIVVPVIAGVERNRANARRPLGPVGVRITVHSEGDEVHLDRHQDTGRDRDNLVHVTLHCAVPFGLALTCQGSSKPWQNEKVVSG